MGTGGTEWVAEDILTESRLNQKTVHVSNTEPPITYSGMLWFDTTSNILKRRNTNNDAWLSDSAAALIESDIKYVITIVGETIYATNAETGEVDYSGSQLATVANAAMGALTDGRTWKEKVLIKGYYTGVQQIQIPSYTKLQIEGRIVAESELNVNFIVNDDQVSGNTDIELCGSGLIDPNGSTMTASVNTIHFSLVTNSFIRGITYYTGHREPAGGEGIAIEFCRQVIIDGVYGIATSGNTGYDLVKIRNNSRNCAVINSQFRLLGGTSGAIQISNPVDEEPCEHNLISNNVIYGGEQGAGDGSGVKIHNAIKNLVVNNSILEVRTRGIDMIQNASYNVIKNNIVRVRQTLPAIDTRLSTTSAMNDNIIEGNIIYMPNVANAIGIQLDNYSSRTRVENNVVFGSSASETALKILSGAVDSWIARNDFSDPAINNIFVNSGQNTTFLDNRGIE